MGVVGYIVNSWIHTGALWGSLGSSGVVGLSCVCPSGRCVHPGSLSSLARTVGFVLFTHGRPKCRFVRPGSLYRALGVVWFTRVSFLVR